MSVVTDRQHSRRDALAGAAVLVGAGVLSACTGASTSGAASSTSPSVTASAQPGAASSDGPVSTASPSLSTPTALPFTVNGSASASPPVEVLSAPTASTTDLWSFGGDYRLIGSTPVDDSTVFGSATDRPDSLMSYAAALITGGGFTRLTDDPPATVDTKDYVEPQDGTVTDDWIVWRAAPVSTDASVGATADDWEVWAAPRSADARGKRLGAAADLNPDGDTPSGPEVVPTANGSSVYFASNVGSGQSWTRHVVRMALDGDGRAIDVTEGDFPAAVEDGVLYATPDGAGALTRVAHRAEKGGDATELLTITSDSSSWRIGGLWAAGAHRAVAIVSDEDGSGSYLGTWKDGEDAPSIWLHVASGGLVGSASATRFAWGGGSDAVNAEMFVTDWEGTSPNSLGKAPGYARPALSPDGAVVLVPATDGTAPARWTLKRLAA